MGVVQFVQEDYLFIYFYRDCQILKFLSQKLSFWVHDYLSGNA